MILKLSRFLKFAFTEDKNEVNFCSISSQLMAQRFKEPGHQQECCSLQYYASGVFCVPQQNGNSRAGKKSNNFRYLLKNIGLNHEYLCLHLTQLTHWNLMRHICIRELDHYWFRWWLATCLSPSHYLNWSWLIVNWKLRNQFQWNLNQNTVFHSRK